MPLFSRVNGQQRLLMLGNPGAGKSTLLNGLMGEVRFPSGDSAGTGMTTSLQWEEKGGIHYGDVPGLADAMMRKQAAEEISKAIKSGGEFKLIFVVTAEADRIRPEDVSTFQVVLDAVLPKNKKYGIIINKVPIKKMKQVQKGELDATQIVACLNSHKHEPTRFIFPYGRHEDLECEPNALHTPSDDLLEFIAGVPSFDMKPEEAEDVAASEFEAIKEAMQAQITKMRYDQAALQQKLKKDRETWERQIRDMQAQHQHDLANVGGCFTAASVLDTPLGPKAMADLKIGDTVRGASGVFEDVIGWWDHYISDTRTDFIRLHYDSSTGTVGTLTLTPNHLICVSTGFCQAQHVAKGSQVYICEGGAMHPAVVRAIDSDVHAQGLYGPATLSGTIIVDSVMCSAYAKPTPFAHVKLSDSLVHWLCHGISAPVRWFWMMQLHALPQCMLQTKQPTGTHLATRVLKCFARPIIAILTAIPCKVLCSK